MSDQRQKVYSVSSLNRLARGVLENEIGQIWLNAEISNFTAASSGHWYFTLKDDKAQIRAAMFRNSNSRVKIRPQNGDKVLLHASISLYEARGDYQLIVEHLENDGEGLLKQRYEELKSKLHNEGLFAAASKQVLPSTVQTVGVITSSTGAALHDILTVLQRRNPLVNIIIYPTQVQGDSAAKQIAQQIFIANQRHEVDVLIVGRGGGSLEDLWCFNEEIVARAIFASQLPIVSAVGHEIDVTIADFVADVRAATPSAAAELVSQDQTYLLGVLNHYRQRLQTLISQQLTQAAQQVDNNYSKLRHLHPQRQLTQQQQSVDQLQMRLFNRMQHSLNQANHNQVNLCHRIAQQTPKHRLSQACDQQQGLTKRLLSCSLRALQDKQQQFANLTSLLDSLSPLATLARGYSITFDEEHNVVHSSKAVKSGTVITNRLADGEIKAKVL